MPVECVRVCVAERGGHNLHQRTFSISNHEQLAIWHLFSLKRVAPVYMRSRGLGSSLTLMRTSPAWGGSTITVVTSRGFLASQAMAATHSMGCTSTPNSTHDLQDSDQLHESLSQVEGKVHQGAMYIMRGGPF
jgi:hypothetical protein